MCQGLLKDFKAKRKDYNHYTEKIQQLENGKIAFEDTGSGKYTKEDVQKLLRVADSYTEREEVDGCHSRVRKARKTF